MRWALSPSLTKCAGHCAPNCQARSITSAQEPKAPNTIPAAALRITFNSVLPLWVSVHSPSISSVPPGDNCGAVNGAFRSHWQAVLLTQPTQFPAWA